jgi:hypothetical protein
MSAHLIRPKMNALLVAGVLIPQFFIVGCAKDDSDKNNLQAFQPYQLYARSEDEAKTMAKNGTVNCAGSTADACHPAVGMLAAYHPPSKVSQCTAFLVSSQFAITNSHCIPADLKAAGSDCSERMWLHFPEIPGYSKTRVGCVRVLTASELPAQAIAVPDYAVIQLDQPVNRPPLKISREGFKNDGVYHIMKVDPKGTHSVEGELVHAVCKAKQGSILVGDSGDDRSSNLAFADCDVIHGNSGSPLLDSNGNVNGVIQIRYDSDSISGLLLRESLPMVDTAMLPPMGAGTNFACLKLPDEVPAPALPAQCSASKTAGTNSAVSAVLTKRLSHDVEGRMKDYTGNLDPVYQWTLVDYSKSKNEFTFITAPECIRDMKTLLARHRRGLGGYESRAEEKATLQLVKISIGLNRYLVPDYRIESPTSARSGVLNFSAADLAKSGAATMTVSQSLLYLESGKVEPYTIKACQK